MTREQLDAIASTYKSAEIDALCAQAREALELREALEWAAMNDVYVQRSNRNKGASGGFYAETWSGNFFGATPLEAINKARRGM